MPRKQINIEIKGECGSGKTRIAYILARILENLEFEVDYKLNDDFTSITQRCINIEPHLPEALFSLTKKTKITITVKQDVEN